MNFQTVEAGNGNRVPMLARVAEIGTSKLSQSNKPYQSAKLTDDTGETHSVTIHQGNGQLLDASALGQRLAFSIQTYQGQQGTAYSGFWNNKAQTRQSAPPQQTSQLNPPPQSPQNAPQATKATRNGREVSIERQAAFKAACEYCGLRGTLGDKHLIEIARAGHYFIETGNNFYDIPEPDESITEQSQTQTGSGEVEVDIPF